MTDETPDAPETGEPQLPEALLQALRAPGAPEELAGESEVLAAFRAARREAAPRLRVVRRVGAGGVAVVATVVLGSGVAAAAYTNSLPEPVQQIAHRVLAPIGVPAAAPGPHRPKPTVTALPSPRTTSARPTTEPSRTRSHERPHPAHRPTRTPTSAPAAPAPTGSPSPSAPTAPGPTASATAAPSSTSSPSTQPAPTGSPTVQPSKPPKPLPASISLALSASRVAAGSTVLANAAAVDAAGEPAAKQRVALQATTGAGWVTVDTGVTGHLGTVSLYSPAITQNTRFRLRLTNVGLTKPLLSSVARVTETPELIATFESGAIRISTVGAQPGDTLRIDVVQNGVLTPVGMATISAGSATFAVDQGTAKQRYVVLLPRTPEHAGARASVVVPRATGR